MEKKKDGDEGRWRRGKMERRKNRVKMEERKDE